MCGAGFISKTRNRHCRTPIRPKTSKTCCKDCSKRYILVYKSVVETYAHKMRVLRRRVKELETEIKEAKIKSQQHKSL